MILFSTRDFTKEEMVDLLEDINTRDHILRGSLGNVRRFGMGDNEIKRYHAAGDIDRHFVFWLVGESRSRIYYDPKQSLEEFKVMAEMFTL